MSEDNVKRHSKICAELTALYDAKNHDYDRMIKIKPCPFCGNMPATYRDSYAGTQYRFYCANESCGCYVMTHFSPTIEQAAEVWNRRPGEGAKE